MSRYPSTRATQEEPPIQWVLPPDLTTQVFPAFFKTEQRSSLSDCPSAPIQTLFSDLDHLIGGLRSPSLIVLGARPATGKTALALNIAGNVGMKQGKPLGIFSLDMTAEEVAQRLVCSQAGVKLETISQGLLGPTESERVTATVKVLHTSTLIIDDSSSIGIFELVTRAQKMKERFDIALLIVDYVQLVTMYGPYVSTTTKYQDASEVVRMLKALARELKIPILCLSQLSRKVEERPGQRPILTDLQGSSSLEDLADVVMFLLRRDDYASSSLVNMAELIVAKNRHGALGNIPLLFHKESFQFKSPADTSSMSGNR